MGGAKVPGEAPHRQLEEHSNPSQTAPPPLVPSWRSNPQPSCCDLTARASAASCWFNSGERNSPSSGIFLTFHRGEIPEEERTQMGHVVPLLKGQSTIQQFPLLVFFERMTLIGCCPSPSPFFPPVMPFSFPHHLFTAAHEFRPPVSHFGARRHVSCHPTCRQT